jgi:hypothetical protein
VIIFLISNNYLLVESSSVSSKREMVKPTKKTNKIFTESTITISSKAELKAYYPYVSLSMAAYDILTLDKKAWTLVKETSITAGNAYGFTALNNKANEVVVAIRGTVKTSFSNIVTDLKFFKVDYEYCSKTCKVHTGFNTHYMSLRDGLDSGLKEALTKKPDGRIVITGHSLGGATATLYANHFKNLYPKKTVVLYTFGSPRVGNEEFAKYTRNLLGTENIFRVTWKKDIVPMVPPAMAGFSHVSDDIKFTDKTVFQKQQKDDGNVLTASLANHSEYPQITIRRRMRKAGKK